jgi:S-adenosylmethionine:tRNA ribosyltransferase-isomerase
MHQEIFYFYEEDIHFLFGYNNIVAVGTTSLRMVESLYWIGERLLAKEKEPMYLATFYPYNKPKSNFNEVKNALLEYCRLQPDKSIRASTSLMIVPGYIPSICRGIVTNFHQPSSTLLMLISALVGDENRKRIYQEALTKDYRFLSYGDSSLLIW